MTQTHSTHDAPQQTAALPPALANINSNVLDDAILRSWSNRIFIMLLRGVGRPGWRWIKETETR